MLREYTCICVQESLQAELKGPYVMSGIELDFATWKQAPYLIYYLSSSDSLSYTQHQEMM